jgi:hypothetical protein
MYASEGDAMHDDGERQPTDAEQTVEADELEQQVSSLLHDPVLRWRAKILADNGMNPRQARALAVDRRIDARWVVDHLLAKGCDPDIAFDIASF